MLLFLGRWPGSSVHRSHWDRGPGQGRTKIVVGSGEQSDLKKVDACSLENTRTRNPGYCCSMSGGDVRDLLDTRLGLLSWG